MRLSVLLVLGACSAPSSDPMTVDGAVPGDGTDGDSVFDGHVAEPRPCPTAFHEVARIPNVGLQYIDESGRYTLSYSSGMFTQDIDHDGKADVLTLERKTLTDEQIRVFPRTAQGFAPAVVSVLQFPEHRGADAQLADVNGDHLTDLVFQYEDAMLQQYVFVALQTPAHTFALQPRVRINACVDVATNHQEYSFGIAIVDLDRDGKSDVLATLGYSAVSTRPKGLQVLRGGVTNLRQAECLAAPGVTRAGIPAELATADHLWTGDFDGDGATDVLGGIGNQVQLFRSTAENSLTAILTTTNKPDLEFDVTFVHRPAHRAQHELVRAVIDATTTNLSRIHLNTSGLVEESIGTLVAGYWGTSNELYGLVPGDFNGDGFTDVFEIGVHNNEGPGAGPYALTCDQGPSWETKSGTFPHVQRSVVRGIDLDGTGTTGLVALQGGDLAVYAPGP